MISSSFRAPRWRARSPPARWSSSTMRDFRPGPRNIQPPVLAKIASYDPGNLYGVPLGWYATGLLYDVDKARDRIGGAPDSWNALFSPNDARKMADCGVVFPG